MLLTISTTHRPATDLGYLLYKNPAKLQTFELNFGRAHVFYPEATDNRCTAALLLEVDPVGLVRNRRGPSGEGFALEQYVNDRPYAASSFLSVAIAEVFGSALSGNSRERPELVSQKLPFIARVPVLPCRGGEALLRRLFEPLGYTIEVHQHPLDEQFPEWGEGRYWSVELRAQITLHDLLTHLYMLIPTLDGDKHYWIGDDEVDKLLRHGAGWLAGHPEKELIVNRYLKRRTNLTRQALERLLDEDQPDPDEAERVHSDAEQLVERNISLNEQRLGAVMAVLTGSGARRVLDLGCSTGNLLRCLLGEKQFEQIVGMDVSHRALEIAADKLHLERMPPLQRQRISLIQGSLGYRDKRLNGFDAAAIVEVIEHLDKSRLTAFERILFEFARPKTVVITTPNVEYNVKFETLPAGKFRHQDHRFEWTRQQFQAWAGDVAQRFGYNVRFLPIGPDDVIVGSPTQMAVFTTP
ncbi:MAG: 3' terminal RNA ribose 2'-O-methyltransferase Hen1 [Planctomycetota bacterium]|nr:3' terminal RNA ribose 2'-O-methyltransferase Hen1 [Planctomycetota bacterium]